MTDLDLERLGDVWRQEPDLQELKELMRAAETVRRRARWLQAVDIAAAIVVGGVVLWLVLSNPTVDTMLVGGGAILILLVSQVRSRRFRQQELRSLSGSAEQMLDQSIERLRATLKRAISGIVLLPLAILLGYWIGYVALPERGAELAERIARQPGLDRFILAVVALALVAALIHLVRTIGRSRRELERLTALRDSYTQDEEAGGAE
jgi:succinate dehydrogenase/fumarate reductase cytochrome b subunit